MNRSVPRSADRHAHVHTRLAVVDCAGIGCNEALSQIDIKGVGRDIFWPPEVPTRDYTVESIVGPRHLSSYGCAEEYADMGLRGAPMVRTVPVTLPMIHLLRS